MQAGGAVRPGVTVWGGLLRAPADYPYGERQYSAQEFAGHHWTVTQTIADFAPRIGWNVSRPPAR